MRLLVSSVIGCCVLAGAAQEGDSRRLALHGRQLLQLLEKTPGQDDLAKGLWAVLGEEKVEDFPEKFHKVLGPRCLIGVTINPESRVKAARGDAPARLRKSGETVFLIRLTNEAGVTHPLKVSVNEEGRWLKPRLQAVSAKGLSGATEEYFLLRLTANGTGKREATLTFDVGQGTQELGFRAEVPVLFTLE
jgi:hypothetical protein